MHGDHLDNLLQKTAQISRIGENTGDLADITNEFGMVAFHILLREPVIRQSATGLYQIYTNRVKELKKDPQRAVAPAGPRKIILN
jgi:hypothetical protein